MKNSRLIKVIRLLDPGDFRQVQKALKSPFFTSNKNLLALFQTIRKYHPEYSSSSLEKKNVFLKVFPNTVYSDVKLRNLMGELSQLIEEYLVIDQIRKDSHLQKSYLAKAYSDKDEWELGNKEVSKIKESLEKSKYRDIYYYQQLFHLVDNHLQNNRTDDIKTRLQLLQEKDKYLELFYQLSKMQLNSELKSSLNIMSMTYSETNNWATKHLSEKNLIYQLYQKAIQLHDSKKENIFAEFKTTFTENIEKIPVSFQETFLLHLINFAIGQMKEDDLRFNSIALELYILGLNHSIILRKGIIRYIDFFNIVVMSAKEKRLKWCEQFIEDYSSCLLDTEKEDTIILSRIYLSYYQGKFSDSIDLINQHKFTDFQKHVTARIQGIRCYFELFLTDQTYFSLFIDQSHAFEKFIRRSQILGDSYKKAMYNFTQLLRKIANLKIKAPLDSDTKKNLLTILDNQNITISRSWLIEKINH